MTTQQGAQEGLRKPPRGCAIFIGVLLAIIALVAVFIGRGGLGEGSFISGRGSKEVTGVIGSEKREYFEDPEVVDRLTELGFTVNFTTAGSRRIANETNLAQQDFVFPSSGPAAQKITDQDSNYSVEYPFFSPMAVATFKPIARILEKEGVATEAAGKYTLDVGEFITLTQQGKRWRDFGNTFPSQRNVQVATTDIRTSNSAAMWLAILAWEFGESNPDKADDIGWLTNQIAPFFTGQGYTQSSSAGPFADYLSQGMGAVPMVLVYEAQFLGEQMKESSRLKDDMVLMHLEPTVLANHGIVGISPEGKELAQALASDQELQQLAAWHGFRPATGDYLTTAMEGHGLGSPAHYDNSVDPPSFDRMEKLIEGVGNRYGSVPPRNQEEQEK